MVNRMIGFVFNSNFNSKLAATQFVGMILVFCMMQSCTHKVKIEPSDKPFVVNLNVNIDHRIRVDIEEQNKDILSLEDEYLKSKGK